MNTSCVIYQQNVLANLLNAKVNNISYHVISYHIISYHIISYHIISHHIYKGTNLLLKLTFIITKFFVKTNVPKLFKNQSSNCIWEYPKSY